MAICWRLPAASFDALSAWSPERYSLSRTQQQASVETSVPLASLVMLRKETFSPTSKNIDRTKMYVVLDTSHAYEGRIQFRGRPASVAEVGSVKRPLKAGYVIVSRLRTYLRQVAFVDESICELADGGPVCSTEFCVLSSNDGGDIAFLVPFLLSEPVQKIFSAAEEGGHHPRVPIEVLMNLAVPLKLLEIREKISLKVRKSIKNIRMSEEIMNEVHMCVASLK